MYFTQVFPINLNDFVFTKFDWSFSHLPRFNWGCLTLPKCSYFTQMFLILPKTLTRSISGYEILVLSCQRLPTSVRVYSYLQSHASSSLPEHELLLAQWGARDRLQRTRTRVWQNGMPEVAQNRKSQTYLLSLVLIAEVANKSNLGQKCPWKTKTFTVGNLGQKWPSKSFTVGILGQKWPRSTKTFTIGILGQKWPTKTKTFTVGNLGQKRQRKNKNFHHWYPWPNMTKKNKNFYPFYPWPKMTKNKQNFHHWYAWPKMLKIKNFQHSYPWPKMTKINKNFHPWKPWPKMTKKKQ